MTDIQLDTFRYNITRDTTNTASQVNCGTGTKRKLRRTIDWSPFTPSQALAAGSTEFKQDDSATELGLFRPKSQSKLLHRTTETDAKTSFFKTMAKGQATIRNCERIRAPGEGIYEAAVQGRLEKTLWHGTTPETALKMTGSTLVRTK